MLLRCHSSGLPGFQSAFSVSIWDAKVRKKTCRLTCAVPAAALGIWLHGAKLSSFEAHLEFDRVCLDRIWVWNMQQHSAKCQIDISHWKVVVPLRPAAKARSWRRKLSLLIWGSNGLLKLGSLSGHQSMFEIQKGMLTEPLKNRRQRWISKLNQFTAMGYWFLGYPQKYGFHGLSRRDCGRCLLAAGFMTMKVPGTTGLSSGRYIRLWTLTLNCLVLKV